MTDTTPNLASDLLALFKARRIEAAVDPVLGVVIKVDNRIIDTPEFKTIWDVVTWFQTYKPKDKTG